MSKVGVDYIGISTPFYCHDGQGNILLHKRSDKCRDERGTWDCGGGRLDFNEDPEKGVLRELKEEYGCQGVIQEKLPYYSIKRDHEGESTHWIALPFIIKVNPNEVKNNEPEKISKIGWFKLDNLPPTLHKGFSFGLNKYRQELEKYISKS